ncbi:hypothetical protein RQP46_010154 [Phenoliferia psychrophenolica]
MVADAAPSFESTSALHQVTLSRAIGQFRSLLGHATSSSWRPLPAPQSSLPSSGGSKGKGKEGSSEQVVVHRRKGGQGKPDVIRASVEFAFDGAGLDEWRAVLATPEVRSAWDKLVEHAHDVELVDSTTRISKTDYRLGWPASPRDTITISRTLVDSSTLIDISTSLPRSADEPAFLRPAPPYVRSQVHLLAFSVQLVPPPLPSIPSSTPLPPPPPRGRLTLHLQWSHKGATPTPTHATYSTLLSSLIDHVRTKGSGIPLVKGYGSGIEVASSSFERSLEMRVVEYCVLPDEIELENPPVDNESEGIEALERRKERKRLERTVEVGLGGEGQGWDVRLGVKGVGDGVALGWTVVAEREGDTSPRLTLRFKHERVERPDAMVRVSLTVQRLAGGKGVKVNGDVVPVERREPRDADPSRRSQLGDMWDETATIDSQQSSLSPSLSSPLDSSLSLPTTSTSLSNGLGNGNGNSTSNSSSTIRSLLKRNYIYFTSLLQEPEAKWRHVSDQQGVTVTQLNSIDPTLTIYRAEATFVGVGVWDVFATVCTPGARAAWEKTFEDARLVEDVSELSEVWWARTKGAWPVAPRDSVTLRTAYKSPSSVHIFSFSTDDTSLFPSLPPAILPTIRTQTSLYGWAIEALSPTTTQITLLDQSDPKGWSNKSWTPSQMIAAVAGVGDFSIKSGGPPVVTRLVGAKKTEESYEVEKGSLRVEYRAGERILEGESSQEWDSGGSGGEKGRGGGDNSEARDDRTIECEIRCDCATWASSIDLVIDPPPIRFSCLSRHRLSSGGGMWITIEHDARLVASERVLVLVRKGAGGREKGTVTVNGSKAKVDVELLPEDELKLLAKRKRVKASPIPLDQYSTHGPHVLRTPSLRSGRHSPSPSLSSTANNKNPFDESTVSSTTLSTSPLSQPSLIPDTPPPPPTLSSSTTAQKKDIAAPTAALEALAWLQTFHAEQGPELADPAPGWAIVAERSGTVVRKKIIPAVSDSLPVYRGDKIVQGLTADEIASVVASVGCRKHWDERVESAIPLASYGHGLSTAVQTTKPTFPFKGRIFHVATVNAHVRVPSASAAASTSTVLFNASASYTPDGTFDDARTNPLNLLPGQILLEGWILETLDPYTSSMLAIPSTRCTYVACIDHSGSVPLALNSVLNANLARLISAVEGLGKSKGPLPRLWTPDAGLQIEGPLSDDGVSIWNLSNAQSETVLLDSDFEIEDGVFRALFHIAAPPTASSSPVLGSPSTTLPPAPHLRTRSSAATLAPPKTSTQPAGTILKSELPRSASLNFGAVPSPSLQSPATLARKVSSSSLRSISTVPAPKSSASGTDLVVCELLIDLKQFPHGYSIISSSSLTLDSSSPLSIEPLRSLAARQVPLRATAHDAPLPPIVSASLDSWKRANHLIRILVPTAAITHPVQDPLRDASTPQPKPEWFRRLEMMGALVDVRIVPLPPDAGAKTEGKSRVTFNGETLPLGGQKDSRAVLSRMEDEDWTPNGAKISRSAPRKKKTSEAPALADAPPPELLPPEFATPIAVAVRLLAPKVETPILEDVEFPDPKSPGSSTPNHDNDDSVSRSPVVGGVKFASSPLGSRREHANSDASANGVLTGILGAYPLSRLSSTMTTTTTTTSATSPPRTQRTYTLTFVLLASLISFLLGSLLRSLLTPADYIIYQPHPPGSEQHQVELALMQAFDPDRRWREARRLLEIRSFFFSKWDLIFAAVRQGG